MKVVGLITEYNPYHNGHQYHLEEALRITGADKAIVVMSGDFVQRGTPAIIPKHIRTSMALASGVSLVLELPVRYATASAEHFAYGAIALLDSLACVDYVCFGSECGDMNSMEQIARVLVNEPEEFKALLEKHLRTGLSFPKSRHLAMEQYGSAMNFDGSLLSEPNNILGIEYLKALMKLESHITPVTIKRESSHYHDDTLGTINSSATAIRGALKELESDDTHELKYQLDNQVPSFVLNQMIEHHSQRYPIYSNDFSLLLRHKLMMETPDTLIKYQDITADIANRIMKYRNDFTSWDDFALLIKSKNLTLSRINRCFTHILLDIRTNSITHSKYARVLGFQKKDADLLRLIKEKASLTLITKLGQADHVLDADSMLNVQNDISASNLYELVISHKFSTPYIPEPQKSMIIR